jgi:hypothetical protein
VYQVLQPPTEEAAFAERGKEIVAAAKALGMKLDTEGFLIAWVNGTRVLVERDADQQIIAMALVAVGKRWVKDDFTATVLELRGIHPDMMLGFVMQIAAALGAASVFHQPDEGVQQGDRRWVHVVLEFKLQ